MCVFLLMLAAYVLSFFFVAARSDRNKICTVIVSSILERALK